MITFANIVRILIVAVIVPMLSGSLLSFRFENEDKSAARDIAYGFMLMCVLFLVLAVPMIFMRMPFHTLKYSWTAVIAVLCVISLVLGLRRGKYKDILAGIRGFFGQIISDRFTGVIWIAAVFVIMFEACLPTVRMHVDTDDARFIAEAMEAVEKDTMLLHHAITGKYIGFVPGEQIKDVTSPYPLFIALLSRLFGLHPAITAHTVLPFLLILLSYIVFFMIGDFLTGSDVKKTGLFLLFLSFINLFSFETIYSSGYTLLTIIWQGRSVCAMIMLPFLWYILMRFTVKDKISVYDCLFVMAAALGNTMLSNMGSILAPIFIAAYAFVNLIKRKSLKISVFMCICAVPSFVCILITRILRMFLSGEGL